MMRPFKYKIRHFYLNKYIISLFGSKKYFLSYDYKHKAIWFRNPKVASRTIDDKLRSECTNFEYVYSSAVNYCPAMFRSYFKFSFVRNPESRLISAWKDKVLKQNAYQFSPVDHERMKNLDNFLTWVENFDIDTCEEHLRSQNTLIDLKNIDFLGRFESFTEDFNFVLEKLNIESRNINTINKGIRSDIEITESQRMRIHKIYEKDFQLFYPNEF